MYMYIGYVDEAHATIDEKPLPFSTFVREILENSVRDPFQTAPWSPSYRSSQFSVVFRFSRSSFFFFFFGDRRKRSTRAWNGKPEGRGDISGIHYIRPLASPSIEAGAYLRFIGGNRDRDVNKKFNCRGWAVSC